MKLWQLSEYSVNKHSALYLLYFVIFAISMFLILNYDDVVVFQNKDFWNGVIV